MSKLATAERVSPDASDNFVYARSVLAYLEAAKRVEGSLLEIGTGSGYGVNILAKSAAKYTAVDKFPLSESIAKRKDVDFVLANVPPLPFDYGSFDCAVSFQVIEHIKDDKRFVAEVGRVLRSGGRFILSTPNAPASLTRNPWHVREYTSKQLDALVSNDFEIEARYGVFGNERVMEYYNKNKKSVKAITRWDIFNMQYWLPRWVLQIPYDILNRINRKRLLNQNRELTTAITVDDYFIAELDKIADSQPDSIAFDILYILKRR